MITKINSVLVVFTMIIVVFASSCRSESDELPAEIDGQFLKSDSKITGLILRAVANDGSSDDSLDKSSCFSIKFPYTITVGGAQTTLTSQTELESFESTLNPSDNITFSFPITAIFSNFSETVVTNATQFQELKDNCTDNSDTIACIDFEYPFTASGFDLQNQLIQVMSFENDKNLYDFINRLKRDDFVNLDFPITLNISDGAVLRVSSLGELEDTFDDVLRNRCNTNNN